MNFLQTGRIRIMRIVLSTFVVGLLGMAPAVAAVDAATVRSACTSDAFRLCGDAMPDVARTKACLASHRASLSPACRAGMSGGRGGGATHHRYHHRRH